MYLAVVLIDYLDLDGNLQTIKVISNNNEDRIIIDRIEDIRHEKNNYYKDMGGVRIYNLSDCKINEINSKLKNFRITNDEISFQFEHMSIPLYPVHDYTIGYYNLILPVNFKLLDFHIVDPYDKKNDSIESKKHFRYEVLWDKKCNTHLINMELRSRRGTFSFILKGRARLLNDANSNYLKDIEEKEDIIGEFNLERFDSKSKEIVNDFLIDKIDWLELKPNFFGIGLNFNQIIKDSISSLKNKLKKRD